MNYLFKRIEEAPHELRMNIFRNMNEFPDVAEYLMSLDEDAEPTLEMLVADEREWEDISRPRFNGSLGVQYRLKKSPKICACCGQEVADA